MRIVTHFLLVALVLAGLSGMTAAGQSAWYYHVKAAGTGGKPVQSEAAPGLPSCWNSINAAFAAVKSRATPGPWIIQVDDEATYDEAVSLSDFQTSSAETLTLTEAPWLSGRPTIYPRQVFRRTLAINGPWPGIGESLPDEPEQVSRRVTHVTVRGFIFKNNASGTDRTTEECVFTDNQSYLTEGLHLIEDCVFDGQNQVYDSRNPIGMYRTCVNTVFRRNMVRNFIMNDTNTVNQFGRYGHGGVFVMTGPVTNLLGQAQVTIADNTFCENQGFVAIFAGRQKHYALLFERNKVIHNHSIRYPIMLIEHNVLSNIVRNNQFAYNASGSGILSLNNASNTKMYHNTFFNSQDFAEVHIQENCGEGMEIKNNIFWPAPGGYAINVRPGCTENLVSANNAFFTDFKNDGYPPGFGFSRTENTETIGEWNGEAMTTDAWNKASKNNTGNGYTLEGPGLDKTLHLVAGSVCIDRGVSGLVSDDFDGGRRPVGAGYDIGADEYGSPGMVRPLGGEHELRLEGQQLGQGAPLSLAAYRGDLAKIEVSIHEGVDINQLDGRGYAPLPLTRTSNRPVRRSQSNRPCRLATARG